MRAAGIKSRRHLGLVVSLLVIAAGVAVGLDALRSKLSAAVDRRRNHRCRRRPCRGRGRADGSSTCRSQRTCRSPRATCSSRSTRALPARGRAGARPISNSPRPRSRRSAACCPRSAPRRWSPPTRRKRATTNLDLATRTVERLRPLAAKGYVPVQQLDQAQTAQRDAATSLQQAQEQKPPRVRAIDTDAAAEAAVRAREAALAIARRALDDTTVRATACRARRRPDRLDRRDGRAVPVAVHAGQHRRMVRGRPTSASSTSDAIAVGDCATVYSMIDRSQPIKGIVQGIGSGVLDRTHQSAALRSLCRALPELGEGGAALSRARSSRRPPPDLMRLGASAIVEVQHGPLPVSSARCPRGFLQLLAPVPRAAGFAFGWR